MRVKVERSGGFANVHCSVTVDEAPRADELRRLIAATHLSTFPVNPTPLAGNPDRFVYRLTVSDERGSRAAAVSEDSVSPEVHDLRDWIERAVSA